MKKFHITPTGQVRQCTATQGKCRYSSNSHFETRSKAEHAAENMLSKDLPVISTIQKKDNENEPAIELTESLNSNQSLTSAYYLADRELKDSVVENALLSRIKKYKLAKSVDEKVDQVMLLNAQEKKTKVLQAAAENPNVNDITLLKIVALHSSENRTILSTTKNKKLLSLAYLSDSAKVRKNALENPLTKANDLYAVTLQYPKNYYTKEEINTLTVNNYDVSHIGKSNYVKPNRESRILAATIKKLCETHETNKLEDLERVVKTRNSSNYESFISLTFNEQKYSSNLSKAKEIIELRRYKLDNIKYKKSAANSVTAYSSNDKGKINTTTHKKNDFSKNKAFKNNNPEHKPATYEESINLQKRWDKGLDNLPVETQKEILHRKPESSQEGLRAIVDIFKTTSVEGQMAKNGLSNFVNHINHMREQETKKGYIAVDNPEFKTPSGLIKIEEHIGNKDYGEKIVFRINGEKFEMGKQMRSNNWSSFIHVKENIEEEPPKKKGFWAKIFSKNDD